MADKASERMHDDTPDDAPELRHQLARRLAVAGGLVAVLLGLLAAFDHLSQPADDAEPRVFTEPVPVAPKRMVTQPVLPAEPSAPEAPVENAEKTPSTVDVPAEAPPPPAVVADPGTAPAPAAARRLQPRHKSEPPVVPEMTSAPALTPPPSVSPPAQSPAVKAPPTAAAQPSARVVESRPAAVAAPRLFSGFVLQAGVFASAERAEELHARLTLNGVPSQIETRVQVGPFKTRQEAIDAQAKLKELGVDTILVQPKGGR